MTAIAVGVVLTSLAPAGMRLAFLAFGVHAALVFFGMGKLIFADLERGQVRYEQCIAADKQWVQGSCVK